MSIFEKIKAFVLAEDDDFDDEITQEEIDAEKNKMAEERKSQSYSRDTGLTDLDQRTNIEPLLRITMNPTPVETVNSSNPFKIVVVKPVNFEKESTKLVEMMKARKPVIVSFEDTETEEAKRIFNFLSGAAYTLNGTVQKISHNIYIFTASNVRLDVKME